MLISRKLLQRPRNPLVFPAGIAPGFNPTHPAAAYTRFSAIPVGGGAGFVNILNGQAGVPSGSPASTMDAYTGPGVKSTTTADKISFANQSTVNDASITIGCICFYVRNNLVLNGVFSSDAGAHGWQLLFLNSNNALELNAWNGTGVTSGFIPATNTPYLFLASTNGTTTNYVIVNLATGQITAIVAGAASPGAVAPGGTYTINAIPAAATTNAHTCAVMFSAAYNSMSALLSWAADPWSFWYPQDIRADAIVGIAAVAPTFTPWITRAPIALGW